MFYHLEGTISEFGPGFAAVDCGGIGFYLLITPSTASQLKKGDKKKFFISEAIGEDHFDLYGFLNTSEKRFFELLTSVSGIGPKAGLSILSYNTPEMITSAIASGNESSFTACPGIGKKTAQRIILELKDKVAKGLETSIEDFGIPSTLMQTEKSAYDEAVSALSVLGYNVSEVGPILKKIDLNGKTTSDIIKEVLKYMI